MRLLNTEEVTELQNKKVLCLFSNFSQLVNGKTDREAMAVLPTEPFFPLLLAADEVYDLGEGYFMTISAQATHKAVNRTLVKGGLPLPLLTFEHTTAIYRVV